MARTADAGKTWTWVKWPGEGSFSSLAYVSPAAAWVVAEPGPPQDGNLLRTTNDGLSWHRVGVRVTVAGRTGGWPDR